MPKTAATPPDTAQAASKSVIPKEKMARYNKSDTRTASGKRKSVDCGDSVAVALRGADRVRLRRVAKANGLGDRLANWERLNEGLFRLAVGNALRNLASQGETLNLT